MSILTSESRFASRYIEWFGLMLFSQVFAYEYPTIIIMMECQPPHR